MGTAEPPPVATDAAIVGTISPIEVPTLYANFPPAERSLDADSLITSVELPATFHTLLLSIGAPVKNAPVFPKTLCTVPAMFVGHKLGHKVGAKGGAFGGAILILLGLYELLQYYKVF